MSLNEEQRKAVFVSSYWLTGIQLASLVEDSKRIDLITQAKKVRLPKKDIKQLEANMKWGGMRDRKKQYDSDTPTLIGLATLEDIDAISSGYGVLLTRLKFDQEHFDLISSSNIQINLETFKQNIELVSDDLKTEFIEACKDPLVLPGKLQPIADKWYEVFLYFLKIHRELLNIYGDGAEMSDEDGAIWYFLENSLLISEYFVEFYNRYYLRLNISERPFYDQDPVDININIRD